MAWPAAISALDSFFGVGTDGESPQEFHVEPETVWHFTSVGNSSIMDDAWLVPDICKNPVGVWRGLERPGQELALCYAGVPCGAFASEFGMEPQLQKNRVLMAFVTDQFIISKWRWCNTDSDGSGFPTSHRTRFRERLWPPQ